MQGSRWALGLAVVAALLIAAPARAAVFTVTTTTDTTPSTTPACSTPCSLRQAIGAAVGGDRVDVPAGTYTLDFGPLAVNSSGGVTISGAGAASTVISAGGRSQVLSLGGEAVATVSGVTIRDGAAGNATGGNIAVGNTSRLTLDHVRVTGGRAVSGGGIAAVSSAALAISASLIDSNTATTSGGGVWISDSGIGTAARVQDTTIAFNTAPEGGGIEVQPNAFTTTVLRAVTIADNQGGGVYLGASSPGASITGSILARNAPFNCGGLAPATDGGGNVESGSECGLAGHQNTDPRLATALTDAGGQTPVLPIAPTSPAVDIVPVASCLSQIDQRDVARPQGAACDAGAFELVPAVAPPPPPTPTPPPPPPPPAATPQPQKSVAGRVVDGTVLVRKPGSGTYVAIDPTQPIPVGSTIDSRNGEIRITALLTPGGPLQSARFFDGVFRITQTKTTTNLALTEALAACKKGKASAAAKKKPKTRKLWGDGSGSFRTQGQYSAATVRGTEWLVQDSCAGTLTRVKHGVVSVRDNVRHRTIILRAGKHYLARP
jgi:CSLREA domain-containing protein